MKDVYVVSTEITHFGKYLEKNEKEITAEAVLPCLKNCNMKKSDLEAIWFANSGWGASGNQTGIRGQVALRPIGIDVIPIINIENACAGGSTAFHQAWTAIKAGLYDCVMAVGMEKMYRENKYQLYTSMVGGMDVGNLDKTIQTLEGFSLTEKDQAAIRQHRKKYPENYHSGSKKQQSGLFDILKNSKDVLMTSLSLTETMGFDTVRNLAKTFSGEYSPWMDIYGYLARKHMEKHGSSIEQLAMIASKNHHHSSMNEKAQYTKLMSVEDVLCDRMISWPITRSMCAPVGDGAAAAILCSEEAVKKAGLQSVAVKVRASVLGSGSTVPRKSITARLASQAYDTAGVGPDDISLAEIHDATAFGELHQCEELGFCAHGRGGEYAESGATALGGSRPVNTSGGLESKGHPIAATGIAQIHEIVLQLQQNAGKRQVENAKVGLTQNGGGALGAEEAAMCIHIFSK